MPTPTPHTASSGEKAPPRAYSTKQGHPLPFLSTQLPWGTNQEPPGWDTRQYVVTLWTVCNYVHQRPVLGMREKPWGTSRALLRYITFMSAGFSPSGAKEGGRCSLQGSPFLTHPFLMGTAASGCGWSLGGLGLASTVTASALLGCAFDFKIKLHSVLLVVCVCAGGVWSWGWRDR